MGYLKILDMPITMHMENKMMEELGYEVELTYVRSGEGND
jgi:hypothetical protein